MDERAAKKHDTPFTAQPWQWLRKHGVRTLEVVTLILAIISFGFYYFVERDLIRETRNNMQADAIARAWGIVTTRASGNSGKIAALEFLHSQGVALDGIDLSCQTMGGGWTLATKTTPARCQRPTYLRGVNLPNASLIGANFSSANFLGADLSKALIANTDFDNVADPWQTVYLVGKYELSLS